MPAKRKAYKPPEGTRKASAVLGEVATSIAQSRKWSATVRPYIAGKTARGSVGKWKVSFKDSKGKEVAHAIMTNDEIRRAGDISETEWERGRIRNVSTDMLADAMERSIVGTSPERAESPPLRPTRVEEPITSEPEELEVEEPMPGDDPASSSKVRGKRGRRKAKRQGRIEEPEEPKEPSMPARRKKALIDVGPEGGSALVVLSPSGYPVKSGTAMDVPEIEHLLAEGYSVMKMTGKEKALFETMSETRSATIIGTMFQLTKDGGLEEGEQLEIIKEAGEAPLTVAGLKKVAVDVLRRRQEALQRKWAEGKKVKHLTKSELKKVLIATYGKG